MWKNNELKLQRIKIYLLTKMLGSFNLITGGEVISYGTTQITRLPEGTY